MINSSEKLLSGSLRPEYPESAVCAELEFQQIVPVLYRFMDEKYIDDFMRDGKLLISTIPYCRMLEDSARKDKCESEYLYEFIDDKGSHVLRATVCGNAFVLCSSLSPAACHNKNQHYCLELHNVEVLSREIAKQLRIKGFDVCELLA